MVSAKLKGALEFAANAATVVICLALIIPVAARRLAPGLQHHATDPGIQVGSVFPALPSISFGDHRATVILFLNTHCLACRQSKPDYDDIQSLIANGGRSFAAYGVFNSSESAESVADVQLRFPTVRVSTFSEYHVSGTPTIIVVDRSGKVRNFWIGKLTANSRANLARLLKEMEKHV